MFTWPETCGFIDYHTCNALRFLGFELGRKHYTSRFTIPQLLTYLRIVRSLGGSKHVSSMEIAEALYALDRARIRENWREASHRLLVFPRWSTSGTPSDGSSAVATSAIVTT
jgi:hypothetical protein